MSEVSSESRMAPAVSRAVQVLTLLSDAHGAPMPLTDLARALGAAKSSTSNICTVLEEARLIERRESGYVLGRRTVEFGAAYLATFDQVREFYRICAESEVLSRELVQIAVLDGTDVLYLARHEGKAPLRLTAGVGDRFPAGLTAVGNALLANLDSKEVKERFRGFAFPKLTTKSTQSATRLQEKLAATRERGYALDEGEVFPNVIGLAMTIPARHSGEQTLAIGVSTIAIEETAVLSDEHREAVLDALRDAVTQLTNPMAPSALIAKKR